MKEEYIELTAEQFEKILRKYYAGFTWILPDFGIYTHFYGKRIKIVS